MKKLNPILWIIGAVFLLLTVVNLISQIGTKSNTISQHDIKSIQASFSGEVRSGQMLEKKMFHVKANTISGESIEVKNYTVDKDRIPDHGGTCWVTIQYNDLEKEIEIPVSRTKVVEYSIGYPDADSVIATIYENGDLEFTGSGKVRTFEKNDIPWKNEDYTHVFFGLSIQAQNIDYWFADNKELIQCYNIPKTIVSMVETFSGCKALENCPELFRCLELKVMDRAFRNCEKIKKVDTLPINVTSANQTFEGCTSLVEAPDLTKATQLRNINNICKGCTAMVSVPQIPQSVENMEGAFERCTNIHEAAPWPPHVKNINSAYKDCIALETVYPIPESVTNYKKCFEGCKALCGTLEINTDSDQYENFLNGAVQSGEKLSLSGNSGYLLEIQKNAKNSNISLLNPDESSKQSLRLQTELDKKNDR